MADRKVVVVLGMHRSGTSMIGGALTCLGVDLGEDAPGRQVSNPLGHFEDRDFLELNQEILAAAEGAWDDPPEADLLLAQREEFSEVISKLIAAREGQHPHRVWGWKDPRTSLLMDLYSPYLENLHILWCQRDPEEIAVSLHHRNHFERGRSLALVSIYQGRIRDFLLANPSLPVLEIPYQEAIQEPLAWIRKIVDFLQIDASPRQIEDAVSVILPKSKIEKEKKKIQLRNTVLLPYRALRKVLSAFRKD